VPPRRPSKIMLDLMPKTSKIFDAWCDIYDDGDPSMEEVGGEAAWREQCSLAINELEELWLADLEDIESRLIDGEFYGQTAGRRSGI
jgi:hypothetical protein